MLSSTFVGRTNATESGACQSPVMQTHRKLADRLKELRADTGRSVEEVADAVGIARSTLSGYENDHDKPGRDTMIALANYYNVSVDWLATGVGNPRPGLLQERTSQLAAKIDRLDDDDIRAVEQMVDHLARRAAQN